MISETWLNIYIFLSIKDKTKVQYEASQDEKKLFRKNKKVSQLWYSYCLQLVLPKIPAASYPVLNCPQLQYFQTVVIPLKPYRPEHTMNGGHPYAFHLLPCKMNPMTSTRDTQTNRHPSETCCNSYAPLCNARDGMYKSGA